MTDHAALVSGVRDGDEQSHLALYKMCCAVVRSKAKQHAPDVLDDAIHDTYAAAVAAISSGAIRNPSGIFHWVCTVASRRRIASIHALTTQRTKRVFVDPDSLDKPATQEAAAIRHEAMDRVMRCTRTQRERDVLMLHLAGAKPHEVMAAFGWTATQERLAKSRMLARIVHHVSKGTKGVAA
jgi:acyl-coenzyme A synthetase/AMP-(fatty) acid ligase